MLRLYCPTLALAKSASGTEKLRWTDVMLDSDEAYHARRVLRLEMGAEVEVFDGQGLMGSGTLQDGSGPGKQPGPCAGPRKIGSGRRPGDLSKTAIRLTRLWTVPRLQPQIEVAAAIPKGPRADAMVEQLSQVGADRLIPLRSERAVVDPGAGKLERFERAAVESAKQCGRAHLMSVGRPATLPAILTDVYDLRLIALPAAPAAHREEIQQRLHQTTRVLILIGPEGGWTDGELKMAAAAGCVPWFLGPHVMRIETAAVVAAGLARYWTIDLADKAEAVVR